MIFFKTEKERKTPKVQRQFLKELRKVLIKNKNLKVE